MKRRCARSAIGLDHGAGSSVRSEGLPLASGCASVLTKKKHSIHKTRLPSVPCQCFVRVALCWHMVSLADNASTIDAQGGFVPYFRRSTLPDVPGLSCLRRLVASSALGCSVFLARLSPLHKQGVHSAADARAEMSHVSSVAWSTLSAPALGLDHFYLVHTTAAVLSHWVRDNHASRPV